MTRCYTPTNFSSHIMKEGVKCGSLFVFRSPKMRENKFQAALKKELKDMFPGCYIFKLDANDIQGIPDLLVLYNDKWATLECKRSQNASRRHNQDYYVADMDRLSFSRFICPENKEEVLDELQRAFRPARKARRSKP